MFHQPSEHDYCYFIIVIIIIIIIIIGDYYYDYWSQSELASMFHQPTQHDVHQVPPTYQQWLIDHSAFFFHSGAHILLGVYGKDPFLWELNLARVNIISRADHQTNGGPDFQHQIGSLRERGREVQAEVFLAKLSHRGIYFENIIKLNLPCTSDSYYGRNLLFDWMGWIFSVFTLWQDQFWAKNQSS